MSRLNGVTFDPIGCIAIVVLIAFTFAGWVEWPVALVIVLFNIHLRINLGKLLD